MIGNKIGLLDLNTIFSEKYNYRKTEKITSQSFVEVELNGKREKFWFYYDNKKYLFKKKGFQSDDIYAEVIANEIAEVLDIDSAKYSIAKFDNELGVISENFIHENERLILGVEIMSFVLNKYVSRDKYLLSKYDIDNLSVNDAHNKLNNLEDIWSILDLYFNDKQNKQKLVKMCIDGLIKTLMFDMLTIQGDRHVRNWGIIANDKTGEYRFAPLFDNSNIFGLNKASTKKTFDGMLNSLRKSSSQQKKNKTAEQLTDLLYHSKLLFSASDDDIIDIKRKKKISNLDVLEYFISISDKESIDLLESYMNKILNIGIENIIENKERKMGIKIDIDVKKHVINSMNLNLNNIYEKFEQYRKGGNTI